MARRTTTFLKLGQVSSIHNVLYALNKPTDGAINITYSEDNLTIQSPYEGEYMTMATGFQGQLVKDSIQPLALTLAVYHRKPSDRISKTCG